MSQKKLLGLMQERYGEQIHESLFSRIKGGGKCGEKGEEMLRRASDLLAERERLLGIENAYTKEV